VVTISTGGEGGTVCNTATADSDLADPVPTDNSDQYCVNGVPQGACGSLGDLLTQVEAGPIPTAKRNQWVRYLQTTIEAANLGRQNVVAQRLGFFVKQVRAAEASGVVDSETADSLEACANSLRQQALLRK